MKERYDFVKTEKEMQEFWRKNEIYRFRGGESRKDEPGTHSENQKEKSPVKKHPEPPHEKCEGLSSGEHGEFSYGEHGVFSIDTPPPTVSGNLHIGHLFSYTQAEIIARHRRMTGYDVFYPFGFDDNGLPTERLVERELGVRAKDLPRSEFSKLCLLTAEKYEAQFRELWESLGFSVDWSLQYQTVSAETQRISQRSFLELQRKGLAYMKESPVLWCTECQTSIAQAELEGKEQESVFYTIAFLVDGEPLPVATTRPELLCGCVCLFVHPEDPRAGELAGRKAVTPLYGGEIPILTDEEADPEKGTGIVMCATFGDMTDASWVQKHSLSEKKVLTPSGRFKAQIPIVGGFKVKAARKAVVEKLKNQGLLLSEEPIIHQVAVHERCGHETEILSSKQWYIDVLSHKEEFLKAGEEISWYPAHMKTRYRAWVENLKWDWCISRQRYFGVPFPVWYCKQCGRPIFALEQELPVNPIEQGPGRPCACGCREFVPETAVFDTWATSSLTPMLNAKWGEEGERSALRPMSLRCQAHEIIRTWAFYTIVKSLYHTGELPWKDIMISGFVLAKRGEKISKSKGNAAGTPQELVKTHSADVMRYWAASAKLGTDTFFDERELKTASRFMTKLWNAAQFVLARLEGFDPHEIAPALLPVDRWILAGLEDTVATANGLLSQYEVGQARLEIDRFFWKDFCDTYIELAKERLYRPEMQGEAAHQSGRYALYHVLLGILKLYAPYTPHVTECLYQQYFRRYEKTVSIHLAQWGPGRRGEETILAFGELLKEVLADARRQKSEKGLSLKSPIQAVEVFCPEKLRTLVEQTEADLLACTGAEKLIYGEAGKTL